MWQWVVVAGLAGLALLGIMGKRGSAPEHRAWSSTTDDGERGERTLPLELGEGDMERPIPVYPANGTGRLELSPGTRIEQLQPKGSPPAGLVAARRVRVTSGAHAGLVAWASGTQVQAARDR